MKPSTSVMMIVSWFLLIGWPSSIAEVRLDSGCIKPETPEHGEMFVLWSGLLVQFRCQSAEYKLVGPAAVICRNRTWTQDPPVCIHHHQLQQHLQQQQQQQSTGDDDSSEVAETSQTVDDDQDGMDDVQLNGSSAPLSMMAAADEDPVSRGKKKNGGGNKGNKKDDKKEDKKKPAKQSSKEPKKEDKKPKTPAAEKKNKGKKGNDNKHSSAKASTVTEARNVNEVESTDGAEESNQNSPVDFATLDQSCLVDADNSNSPIAPAPAIPHGSGIKYIRKRNKGPGAGNRYAAAVFQCAAGYQFVVPDADRLYCRQGRWIGPSPICIISSADHPDQDASSVSNNALTEREEETSNAGSYGGQRSECGEDKGGCEQICDDTSGRATCLCYRGYVLAEDGTTCTDVDECAVDNGGCEGTCVNRQGSYQCFCSTGFRLASNGKKCIDHNECLLRNGHGPCQGTCRNTHGSYECSCDERPGTQLAADGHSCEDLDECSLGDNFGCSHTCLNTLGTAFCTCPDGYMLGDDWKTCEDMDECELEDVGQACAGTCINTIGSFRCSEEDGASSQEEGENGENEDNEEVPEAIQEAIPSTTTPRTTTTMTTTTTTPAPTSTTATPTTTTAPTTTAATTTTTSTTTTETPIIAAAVPVEEEAEEDEDPEEDEADEEGEEGDEEEPEELEDRANRIDNSATATTTTTTTMATNIKEEKTFELDQTCPEGFQLADRLAEVEDGSACLDVDECEAQDQFGCSHLCINTQGSAHCDCPSGWKLSNDGKTCQDLDECTDNNFGCSHRCINTEGSAYCACPSGYALDISNNKTCSDIDECSDQDLPNFGCSHHCINLPGGVECKCTAGYKLRADQKTCKDIDECAKENGGCSHECVNLKGGMRCECPEGYRLSETDAKTCQDIDECESGDQEAGHSCRATGGTCRNTLGSYECICPEGFRTTGTACADIDECLNYKCGGRCINLPGTYRCDCESGYKLEGERCVDIDECQTLKPCKGSCTNLPGSYRCDCEAGYRSEGNACIDLDECSHRNGGCSHICVNTIGSFRCTCNPGFDVSHKNQSNCVDVNECRSNNGGCSQDCINTRGAYHCTCSDQYYLEADGRTCIELPPRCPKMKAPDHGEIECIQNLNHTQHRSREQEDEALIAENGRGDLGASGWSANRSLKSRSLYNSGSTCIIRCNKGYKLVGDSTISCGRSGLWLGEPATCIPLACPKLLAPDSGVLMPHTCSTGKTFAGQQCQVRCRAGYRLIGGGIYHCLPSQQWRSPDEPARCERIDSPVPFIQCPGNMAVNLPPQEKRAYITFSQPKSNMDWFRYVDSDPLWAKQLGGELPVGLNTITFRVRSPVSDLTATCNFTIEIFDKEIPRMTNCPTSWTVFLEPGQSSQIVTWNEPIFTDNIEIVQLNKSREPGELFQAGYHEIAYVAQDGAGNQAKCQFTIHVTSQTVHRDTSSPITKLPRGRVLVRCPGSKPGKYVEMYTYKVPAGCIVINNPSAYTRATVTTLAPRYTVFDWDFGASSGSEGGEGRDSANTGRHPASHNKLVDGVPRLRDAAAPSSPVILPGPALLPSMGSQPLRLNGRARKSRITEPGLQLIPNVPSGSNDPVDQSGRGNKNRNRDKKRGGVVDLLLPFTANDAVLQSTTTIRSGRKRQQGPKHQPKLVPGPSFVPDNERNRKQKEKKDKNASGATSNTRKNKTTTS
ncbi:fibrillin-1-like isoform X4 [Daphnia carinata]|uniref:fibrillin-1-like isoform X4 n=1 Tax=Daphnia carinata TaxID=120202 RepID=UPI0028696A70|nr:fibrillin-1-like isoform X4 [Daphnia carinata]